MKKTITIIVPCYNEHEVLRQCHASLTALMQSQPDYDWEVLMINDGSDDDTLDIIKELAAADPRVQYVDLSRNFGKEAAMLAGMDYAKGDCVIEVDADLQFPPDVIPLMIERWQHGYADVYGRYTYRPQESWPRRVLTRMFYRLLRAASQFDVMPEVGDFRLLDRKCVDALCTLREQQRYTKGLYDWIGFKKCEVTFEKTERVAGTSKYSMRQLFALACDGLTSFTTAPLRLAILGGLIISLGAFLYMLYFLIKTLIYNDPAQGFPTLIVVMLFLGGVELLALGIIGEYVGKIFNETKRRPVYFVNSSSTTPRDANGKS